MLFSTFCVSSNKRLKRKPGITLSVCYVARSSKCTSSCLQRLCWRHRMRAYIPDGKGDFWKQVKYFFLTFPFAIKKSSGCLFNDNDSPGLIPCCYFREPFPMIAKRCDGKLTLPAVIVEAEGCSGFWAGNELFPFSQGMPDTAKKRI